MLNNSPHTVTLGTRASGLARWQTEHVIHLLKDAHPYLEAHIQLITTRGDQILDKPLPLIGGKGVFTAELEAALRNHEIDFAVHSLKDLPTENPEGLTIGAIPMRGNPGDALVSRNGYQLATLPQGATVGTSSRRRAAQLLHHRPDLKIVEIRGNVDTRLRKALDKDGDYDAIILALAGLERLGLTEAMTEKLSLDDMLPAPGQGALAVQCRNDADVLAWLAPINHIATAITVTAERAFLAGLGGGCSLPIASYGEIQEGKLYLRGRITAPNGSKQIDVEGESPLDLVEARELGAELTQLALAKGAAELLETSA
jgi:hydroxymethylbilane synthase